VRNPKKSNYRKYTLDNSWLSLLRHFIKVIRLQNTGNKFMHEHSIIKDSDVYDCHALHGYGLIEERG